MHLGGEIPPPATVSTVDTARTTHGLHKCNILVSSTYLQPYLTPYSIFNQGLCFNEPQNHQRTRCQSILLSRLRSYSYRDDEGQHDAVQTRMLHRYDVFSNL